MKSTIVKIILAAAGVLALGGCQSTVTRWAEVREIAVYEPLAATQPATAPAATAPGMFEGGPVEHTVVTGDTLERVLTVHYGKTTPALATLVLQANELKEGQALKPGQKLVLPPPPWAARKVIHVMDPNQSARRVWRLNYERAWKESMAILTDTGFRLDRQDYRMGVLTTLPLQSGEIVEPWRPDLTSPEQAMENTINSQRRIVRVTIKPIEGTTNYYEIAVQVLVEREANPSGMVGSPAYAYGSAFGRNPLGWRSDNIEDPKAPGRSWYRLGHDGGLEKKILDRLFEKI